MIWICPTQASIDVDEEFFFLAHHGGVSQRGHGNSKNRSEEGQPIRGFGSR